MNPNTEIKQIQAQIEKLEKRLLELTAPVFLKINGKAMEVVGEETIGGHKMSPKNANHRNYKHVIPLLIVREK